MQITNKVSTRAVIKTSRTASGLPSLAAKPISKRNMRSAVVVRAEAESTEAKSEAVKYEPLYEQLQPLYEAAEGVEYSVGGQRWQDLMAFEGFAPEVINGRLAMLGFVAAVGAEITTGQTFMTQLGHNFLPVVFHLGLFAGASVAPAILTGKPLAELVAEASGVEAAGFKEFQGTAFSSFEQLKKFTPEVELYNGRAAMVGIAALIFCETLTGSALFP